MGHDLKVLVVEDVKIENLKKTLFVSPFSDFTINQHRYTPKLRQQEKQTRRTRITKAKHRPDFDLWVHKHKHAHHRQAPLVFRP